MQNVRPGTFDKWGIGYEDCRSVKPDIVYVSISGFGQLGTDHDRPGYDPVAEAASGFMSLNGSPEGRPVRCATYLGDDLAGLHGALAALASLRHRDASGEGQHIGPKPRSARNAISLVTFFCRRARAIRESGPVA